MNSGTDSDIKRTYESVFREGLFDQQVVIVTGGGSGIGRATAHELASLGATVIITGRTMAKLEKVVAEIESAGGKAWACCCDIRSDDSVIEMVDGTLARFHRIDALVNNAGGQFWSNLNSMATKGFEAVVRNNLIGGFIVMREVYNRWMSEHGGAIVNVTADFWMALPSFAHSGAARAGMYSLTQSASLEWAHSGVRVNSVAPGLILSSGFDNYEGDAVEKLRGYPRHVPLQRYGTVAETAAAIVFMLSPAASFITGTCLRVDGGAPNARRGWKLQAQNNNRAFDGFLLDSRPSISPDQFE